MAAEAREKSYELPPLVTAPLPPDRPRWRSVDVSFLLLYYKHPWNVEQIVERLYGCTHGYLGDGALGHGITSELVVNVDSRGDGETWDRVVANYSQGARSAHFVPELPLPLSPLVRPRYTTSSRGDLGARMEGDMICFVSRV